MAGKVGQRAPAVVVAGSVYCDLIFFNLDGAPALGEEVRTDHFTLTPGGGGFITAAGLARLGVRTALRTYVGRDLLGQFQLDAMRRAGIDTTQVRRHPRLGTAVSVAFSTGRDRGFLSYTGCALETGALVRAWAKPSFRSLRHVHFAGMRPPFEPQLRLLDGLREAGVITSLDIGWNPPVFGVPVFKDVIRRVNVFMPSWRDAEWLTGKPTPEEALRALADLVELPVIKLGGEGAVALSAGRPIRVAPPRVQAVDTTGAGDAFNAGFIWAWLRGEPVERCLIAGNVCGALSTRAAGGTTAFPTLRELRDALRGKAS